MRMVVTSLVASCLMYVGCDATVVDLRPLLTIEDTGSDGPSAELVATATFDPLEGAEVAGTVEIERSPTGELRVVLRDDFVMQPTASAVVVLSPFDTLGTRLDAEAGDQELGGVPSGRGPVSFVVSQLPSYPFWVFIYSRAAGVALARAEVRP